MPGTYKYRVGGVSRTSELIYTKPITVTVGSGPKQLQFNASSIVINGEESQLSIGLPSNGAVHLSVFDIQGRLVFGSDLGIFSAGWHLLGWSPRSGRGERLSSGAYYLQVSSGEGSATNRVIVVR